ncbi:MAG: holA [Mucilaginibacter sp.]|nr:holA [Mucilaginibacter sp.]
MLGNLNNFFSKVLVYHYVKDKTPQNLAREMGVNPYFLKDYEQAARNYPLGKIFQVISYLREYDLKSKGVESNAPHGELMKELMFKILH